MAIRPEHRDRIDVEAGTGACAEETLFDPPYLVERSSPINRQGLNLVASYDVASGEEITIDYEYDDIYDLCREVNPHCLRAMCPLLNRVHF